MNWLAQNARLSGFFASACDPFAQEWWQEIAGQPADSTDVRRSLGTRVDSGVIGGATLLLQASSTRFDVLLLPTQVSNSPEIDYIGPVSDVVGRLHERIVPWLASKAPDISRIAVGIAAIHQVKSVSDTANLLRQFLPSIPIDDDPSLRDFMFRTNRPFTTMVDGETFKLNRLMTWAVRQSALIQQLVSNQQSGMVVSSQQIHGDDVVVCDIDINTMPDRTAPIERAVISELLPVMERAAADILAKGNVL